MSRANDRPKIPARPRNDSKGRLDVLAVRLADSIAARGGVLREWRWLRPVFRRGAQATFGRRPLW